MLHSDSQKRIIEEDAVYFITTVTKDRFPYFGDPMLCELFIEELEIAKKLKKFRLHAFCILYDHVHLMVEPGNEYNISEIIRTLKTNFARNANYLLEGDVTSRRLQFIQNGLINHYQYLSKIQNQILKNDMGYFAWQKSYHDHIIRNKQDYDYHLNYTAYNHQKHLAENYPENYKYTSLNYPDLVD